MKPVVYEPKNVISNPSCVNLSGKLIMVKPNNDPPKTYTPKDYTEYIEYIQQGYDMSNLVDEEGFDPDLTCPICLQVLNNPQECMKCERPLCKYCLDKCKNKCPTKCPNA